MVSWGILGAVGCRVGPSWISFRLAMDSHSEWERLEILEGSLSCHVVVLW